MQNAPTASRFGAASSTRAVTRVPDRMPSICTSPIAAISSSSVSAAVLVSTW